MADKNKPTTINATQVDAVFMRNLIAGTTIKAYDQQVFAEPITLEQLNTLAAVGRAFAQLTSAMKDEKAIEEADARIAMMKSATPSA